MKVYFSKVSSFYERHEIRDAMKMCNTKVSKTLSKTEYQQLIELLWTQSTQAPYISTICYNIEFFRKKFTKKTFNFEAILPHLQRISKCFEVAQIIWFIFKCIQCFEPKFNLINSKCKWNRGIFWLAHWKKLFEDLLPTEKYCTNII